MTKLNQPNLKDFLQQEEKSQEWLEMGIQINKIHFRLNGPIEGAEYYGDLLDRIELLTENDQVELIIDSVGGDLEGCIAICDALQSTPAEVTAIITNRAYSAGAYIALCCDNIEVRPYARMMLHSFSGGFSGKDHEIELDYTFNKEYIRNFLGSCAEGFLDDEELEQMYNGKDFWMAAPEIMERLIQRREYFENLYEQEESEDECEGCNECSCKNTPPPEYNPDDVAFKIPVEDKVGELHQAA